MALSPNYLWSEPDNSSLVKNGAADIRTLGDAIDTSVWNVGYGQAGKNKIINGDFGIWQRGTTFASPNGTYTADRWLATIAGGSLGTASQQTFTPATAPVAGYEGQYFLRLASNAGATYLELAQRVEDVRAQAGRTITLSFWAKATSSVTFTPLLRQNFGSGGSANVDTAGATIAVASSSWTRYTVTVTLPSLSGKTIGTSSYLGVILYSSAGTTASNTVDFWGVQVEYGSKATPFQTATGTIQGELAACQRYFQQISNTTGDAFAMGQCFSTTQARFVYSYSEMRTSPSFTISTASDFGVTNASATYSNCSSLTLSGATTKYVAFTGTIASGLVAGNASFIRGNSGSASSLQLSAEL